MTETVLFFIGGGCTGFVVSALAPDDWSLLQTIAVGIALYLGVVAIATGAAQ